MATWEKELVLFSLMIWASGSEDTSVHTVKLQPIDQAYPTGAISCTHKGNGYYGPDSDLDDETHYDIYVDTDLKSRLWALKSAPVISA